MEGVLSWKIIYNDYLNRKNISQKSIDL